MGSKQKYADMTCLSFIAWAFAMLCQVPDFIIHESTPDFDVDMLFSLFSALYWIHSYVCGPNDLGLPCRRRRRYTLMVKKGKFMLMVDFDDIGFGHLFFHTVILQGDKYFCAPDELVKNYMVVIREEKGLPERNARGDPWKWIDLLKAGDRVRLLMHLYKARTSSSYMEGRSYLFNARQSWSFSKSLTTLMPTLLTKTSYIYSVHHKRVLIPIEHLGVMGVPFPGQCSDVEQHYPVVSLIKAGRFTMDEMTHAAGNGMIAKHVGAVILFTLGCCQRVDSTM